MDNVKFVEDSLNFTWPILEYLSHFWILVPFITLRKYIPQENQCDSRQKKRKQTDMLEDFPTDENKDVYLNNRQRPPAYQT